MHNINSFQKDIKTYSDHSKELSRKSENNMEIKMPTFSDMNNQSLQGISADRETECEDKDFLREVCRVCLAVDVKMYHIYNHKLRFMYEQLVGVTVSAEDKLPKVLCWECVARLSSANKFRDKVINSQITLSNAFNIDIPITLKDIKPIKHDFNSTLIKQHFVNHCDLRINENDMINVEVKKENSIESNEDDEIRDDRITDNEIRDTKISDHIKDDNTAENRMCVSKEVAVEVYAPDACVEIKYEKSDVFMETCVESELESFVKSENCRKEESLQADVFKEKGENIDENNPMFQNLKGDNNDESDDIDDSENNDCRDDLCDLLEEKIMKSKNCKVKECLKVEVLKKKGKKAETEAFKGKRGEIDEKNPPFQNINSDYSNGLSDLKNYVISKNCKVEKSSKAEGLKKKGEKIDRKNSISTKGRYIKSGVNGNMKLNESLFTVTLMSHEEQIAEMERKKESYSYKNAPFKCTKCYRGYLKRSCYEAHMMRHDEKKGPIECFICKKRFKTKYYFGTHLKSYHTEMLSCNKCTFRSPNRAAAKRHEDYHSGVMYQCPHCPSEFDKLTTYMSHLRIKHGSKFVCGLCGFTFLSEKGIDVHKRIMHKHVDDTTELEGPYCEECDVRFISKEAHDRHLKLSSLHSNDHDPNRLRNDSTSIIFKDNLAPILQREKAPISCEKCGVVLNSQKQYASHFRRLHPDQAWTVGPNPHMCEQCGRFFKRKFNLDDHMWVHTGVKRHQCERCDKSFAAKQALLNHLSEHDGDKQIYDCHICGRGFKNQSNRQRHMFVHGKSKTFKCDLCGKMFNSPDGHKAHIDHIHNKKPWPKRIRTKKTKDQRPDH